VTMPLSIMVRLRNGSYDAGGQRPSESEWPPHPARVFCALAASAETESGWEALRWLERQPPPQVWADSLDHVERIRPRAYVVQNAIEKSGGNLNWPGRTNGLRTRASTVPRSDSFAIVWPDADPPPDMLNRLNLLAWQVPYVGRSTTAAHVSVVSMLPAEVPGSVVYQPAEFGSARTCDLRVPYAGYTDALRDAYLDGRRAWEVARALPYRYAGGAGDGNDLADPAQPATGPFADLMVWDIERPVARIGGDQVVALTGGLRNAVISRVPDPVPGQVSGHTEPGRPHVAFLALPDVDHAHADGHVLGLALAIPRDLPDNELVPVMRALMFDSPMSKVSLPGGRVLGVRYGAAQGNLRPSQWTAADRSGEREWVTATPLMLDGHLRRGRAAASEVARSLVIAGYPRPADIEVSGTPMLRGAIWRPRQGTLPAGRPRRQMVHAWVRFEQPVLGPVLAGSMRYLGLGLFRPVSRQPRAAVQHGPRGRAEQSPDRNGLEEAAGVLR
jgi:CRISPR-associated protein Csb2